MEKGTAFTERVSGYHKDKFARPRPYDTDRRVRPCVEKPRGSKSYPSSHAAVAKAVSCLLAQVFPEKSTDLDTYGEFLGELRVIIGVHHPSDVKAGQMLGSEICARLQSEPDFAEELKNFEEFRRPARSKPEPKLTELPRIHANWLNRLAFQIFLQCEIRIVQAIVFLKFK